MLSNQNSLQDTLAAAKIYLDFGASPLAFDQSGRNSLDAIRNNPSFSIEAKLKLFDYFLLLFPEVLRQAEIDRFLYLALAPLHESNTHDFELDEIIAIIDHFGAQIDLCAFRSPQGLPALQLLMTHPYLTIAAMINLAEYLLEGGADPNACCAIGYTPLSLLSSMRMVRYPEKRAFAELLLRFQADPAESVSRRSPLFITLDLPYGTHTEEEIRDYLFLLYGSDLLPECKYRELLANSYALDAHESDIAGLRISFCGTKDIKRISEDLYELSRRFYDEIGIYPHSQSLWRSITDQLSANECEYLSQLSSNRLKQLQRALCGIPELLRESLSTQSLPEAHIKESLLREDPTPFLIAHNDHITALFKNRGNLFVCNKGYGSGLLTGISVHSISLLSNIQQLAGDIKSGIDAALLFQRHFPERSTYAETLPAGSMIAYIGQKPQKAGNCPIASRNSLELALLVGILDPIIENEAVTVSLCRAIKRMHASFRRKMLLNEYLELHSAPENQLPPIDIELLIKIALKDSSKSTTCTQFNLIHKWFSTYKPEAVEKLIQAQQQAAPEFDPAMQFYSNEPPLTPGRDLDFSAPYSPPPTPSGYDRVDTPDVPLTPCRDSDCGASYSPPPTPSGHEWTHAPEVPLTPGRDLDLTHTHYPPCKPAVKANDCSQAAVDKRKKFHRKIKPNNRLRLILKRKAARKRKSETATEMHKRQKTK